MASEGEDWGAQYAAYCAEKETDLIRHSDNDMTQVGEQIQELSINDTANKPQKSNVPLSQAEKERILRQQEPELWQIQYAEYCAEKEAKLKEDDEKMALSSENNGEESWQAQYAAYCIEKEQKSAREEKQRITEKSWEEEYSEYCIEQERKLNQQE